MPVDRTALFRLWGGKHWQSTPTVKTWPCANKEHADRIANNLSEEHKAEVRWNWRGETKGHYSISDVSPRLARAFRQHWGDEEQAAVTPKPNISHRVTLVIPSTGQDGELLGDSKHYLSTAIVKRGLADFFGGYTTYQALGGWADERGKIVEEEVTVVEVYTTLTTRQIKGCLGSLAVNLAVELDQQCVLWTLDSEAFFVTQHATG